MDMALTKTAPPSADAPLFWRDAALPFIEARSIADGRKVCYCAHAHEQFSIGCITAGVSTYVSEQTQRQVGAGTVVLMNPGVVHACNPIDDQPWSYRMLYVDTPWLTRLQHELGVSPELQFQPFEETSSDDPQLFADLERLYHALVDPQAETLHKHSCVVAFFSELQQRLNPAKALPRESNHKLERAAQFIRQHCTEPLDLEQICQAAQLSASYLIRAFKQQYGMAPHAYLVNQRVQFAQARLRQGVPIAEVAQAAGFADQAHLQRAFKQHLGATPGQYQGPRRSRRGEPQAH
ncbi:AraC family transcriptional regulator [Pseudomonas protegens]|uniref:AraC family transcriptional regulator n=1 Tax=Pseudomonas protegens TaxID=380021 RepID=UPI0006438EAE|nr:AraC family transcriptional regulator [Pseudomonas protegens]